jgi:hypothetical protein
MNHSQLRISIHNDILTGMNNGTFVSAGLMKSAGALEIPERVWYTS